MIPKYLIDEWREEHPWPLQNQVEQDLLISRMLVELFSHPEVANTLAFRGGTALYKLFLSPPPRYSEDIDLVQVNAELIGPTLDRIRATLDPLLGVPKRKLGRGVTTITYRFVSEETPPINLRIKIEINTREHESYMGYTEKEFRVNSKWFSGEANILTYHLEELLGTKLRALYQRKKGRDLFDLWFATTNECVDIPKMLEVFNFYLEKQDLRISRAEFERNLSEKSKHKEFIADTPKILRPDVASTWNQKDALKLVHDNILSKLPGDPWGG